MVIPGGLCLLSCAFFPWKLPLFLTSLFLISLGWRPYRQLGQLEKSPYFFSFDGECYHFAKGKTPLFSIPKEHVESLEYREKSDLYGIAIDLCGQVELHGKFDMPSFVTQSRDQIGCDLFLPYFTKRSHSLLD